MSPALVVASLALCAALGGVGYAAATIGSAQITDNSVRSKDIRNGTIAPADMSKAARTALKGPAGRAGTDRARRTGGRRGQAGRSGRSGRAWRSG